MRDIDFYFKASKYENENIQIFIEKYWNKRNIIFEYIYNVLEKNNIEENEKINYIINESNFDILNKIKIIKEIKLKNYLDNFKKFHKNEILKKENLDLIHCPFPFSFKLVYYCKKDNDDINNNNNLNKINNIDNEKISNTIKKENINEESINIINLLDIDFIVKIKIIDEEEWICNTRYAFYLIKKIKNHKNPHPKNIDNYNNSNDSDSSNSIKDDINIEQLVYITNNQLDKKEKKLIEVDADLNISEIYDEIKNNIITDYKNKYINYSNPPIEIDDIPQNGYKNNEVYDFFKDIDKYTINKTLIFQDEYNLSSFDKILLLNNLYLSEIIRYFYLNLNILNSIKETNEKRKYLSYYIARIYNRKKNFKQDFEKFIKDILKNIRNENFINDFIDQIIKKNKLMVENMNENIPFYIIIDNIDSENSYKIFEKLISQTFNCEVFIYGILNIDSYFGKKKFISLYNKKYSDIGYNKIYLYSNNVNKNLSENINDFFNEIGNNINILKEFIQLIYFEEYINECTDTNINFLMKYIKYIKLDIKLDFHNYLKIANIKFKSKEIKDKFILNYKDILLKYLNKKNDENIKNLFSETNGIFFEKQIILDILLDKIKKEPKQDFNFKELIVHSIYCMEFDINKIDINQYKGNNIILIQENKTGEIYDFGIIIGNFIKLYQVSIKKTKEDLLKLNRNLIEVDCQYMTNKYLCNFGKYENYNFGLITSKTTYDQYFESLENSKKNIEKKSDNYFEKTPYYLMKDYCKKNKYELLVYDMFDNKFYIENDSNNKLIEYNNFYEFNMDYKLNTPKLNNIFSLKPIKKSIKYVNKDNFISELNKTKLFKDINKNCLNILGKFEYNKNLLDIKKIEEDKLCLCISEKKKDTNESLNIFKYKNESIVCEVDGENVKNYIYKDNNVKIKKSNAQIILFSVEKNSNFLGLKRERNSYEY